MSICCSFAEEHTRTLMMWLATADRGLCASLYAPSAVTARVGEGATVRITEETEYPFGDTVNFRVSLNGTASFPLLLRIPGWCREASVQVNGKHVAGAHALSYATVDREWHDGDTVTLRLPMNLAVRTWEKNHNAVSVERGPLTFSLQIGERWERDGGNEAWPDWNVYPSTPWNYGLALDAKQPASSFTVMSRPGPLPAQPFTPENAPLSLRVAARRIPAWMQDNQGLVNTLQQSPARSTEPLETVTLIPMGCARLRISAFPTIGDGDHAHEWAEPAHPAIAASASHCFESDT
ncbi:MAG TPA: transcriptional initiation protein Tat, partial [Armatimonadota bacterium]|nr:transcriptional initiation protein Tat [Armatimonadota bacterium]